MTDKTDAVPGFLPRGGIRGLEPGNLLAAAVARLLGDFVHLGITRFDSSLGGYGGCPLAPGAAGNLATEGLARHLHASGCDTGIGEARLAGTAGRARDSVIRVPALSGISASH